MKAKLYFEAQGRRDRSQGLDMQLHAWNDVPKWALQAYTKGYVYQEKKFRPVPARKTK